MSSNDTSPPLSLTVDDLAFSVEEVRRITLSELLPQVSSVADDSYVLLSFVSGRGRLRVNRVPHAVTEGELVLLHPGESWEAAGENNSAPLVYIELRFGRRNCGDGQDRAVRADRAALPIRGKLIADPPSRMDELLRELLDTFKASDVLAQLRCRIRLDELLLHLLERNWGDGAASESLPSESAPDSIGAVERTIERLNRSFREPWTIEQLARQANIGVWQYRQLFKRVTGSTPNEYLSELRISRAKELLLASRDSLNDIARQVGYKDEYYFNRRFRQLVGESPRQFALARQARINVAAFTHYGDLLSLGSRPVAVESSLCRWLGTGHVEGVKAIEPNSFGLERTAALRPDLILVNPYTDPQFAAELRHIAPTLLLPNESDMFARLTRLGELVGKPREASEWISRYRLRADRLRRRLSGHIGRHETALYLHIVDNAVYLYRPEEAPVLYEALGFGIPERLKLLLASGPPRLFIPVEALRDFDADRIFFAVSSLSGARETFARIVEDPNWSSREAVKYGRAYRMKEEWTLDGTIALEWQLDGLADLLLSSRR